MHIVFAASECAPLAKTGGLADVVSALPRALVKLGHKVSVFIPYYRQVAKVVPHTSIVIESVTIPYPSYNRFVRVLDGGLKEGVQMYFVDCPEFFDRESFYSTPSGDYPDNAERFGLLCRAVIEASKILGVPDVFHVHDWQAAMLAVLLRSTYYFDPVLRHVPAVLTIHNAGYQGWFPPRTMETLLLPWDMFNFEKLEENDTVNFLKGGIVYSDALTTVSRTYAEEIKTPEFGNGLEGVLQQRSGDLFGILNGVDYEEWDPRHDRFLPYHYDARRPEVKAQFKRTFLARLGLDYDPAVPLAGIVSRLASQKGIDLMFDSLPEVLQWRALSLVALGAGDSQYERFLSGLQERFPRRVLFRKGYDEEFAHWIEAASDMFLMPSLYEPCGLNQMYSLRYGTVPIVRRTGGLADSVEHYDPHTGLGTGVVFDDYDSEGLEWALNSALDLYAEPEHWQRMVRNGMSRDFSWPRQGGLYVDLYEKLLA